MLQTELPPDATFYRSNIDVSTAIRFIKRKEMAKSNRSRYGQIQSNFLA